MMPPLAIIQTPVNAMPFVLRFLCNLWAVGVIGVALCGCQRSGTASSNAKTAADRPTTERATPAAKGDRSLAQYDPTVVLETSSGKLTIRLDAQAAPRTVHNFLHYVENGFYNQTIFHQVDAGYVILGGGYTPDFTEKQGRYPIPNEAANGRKNLRGTVSMARNPDAIDSSTCQFFINLSDNSHLDHRGDGPDDFGYCVFGEVIEGIDVLDRIASVEVRATGQFEKLPVETVLIESAYRLR